MSEHLNRNTNILLSLGYDRTITYDDWEGPENHPDMMDRLASSVGKTYRELLLNVPLTRQGHRMNQHNAIKSGLFGIPARRELYGLPDFGEFGRNRTAAYRTLKDGTSNPTGRLELSRLDFYDEGSSGSFEASPFYKDNRRTKLTIHEHKRNVDPLDLKIIGYADINLDDLPGDILTTIKQDVEKVHKYIRTGRSHLLSGELGEFVAAGTRKDGDWVKQPFRRNLIEHIFKPERPKLAKQRVWVFKPEFLQTLKELDIIKTP